MNNAGMDARLQEALSAIGHAVAYRGESARSFNTSVELDRVHNNVMVVEDSTKSQQRVLSFIVVMCGIAVAVLVISASSVVRIG